MYFFCFSFCRFQIYIFPVIDDIFKNHIRFAVFYG